MAILFIGVSCVVGYLLIRPLIRTAKTEDQALGRVATEVETLLEAGDNLADLQIKPFDRIIHTSGRKEWEIHAEAAQLFQDRGEVQLTTIKQIKFFDSSGAQYEIQADKGFWSQKEGGLRVEGNITAYFYDKEDQTKPLITVKAQNLAYDKPSEALTSETGVELYWESMVVKGDILNADVKNQKVHLQQNIITTSSGLPADLAQHQTISGPITITAPAMIYERSNSKVQYYNGVTVETDETRLQCATLTFYLDQQQHYIHAEKKVELSIEGAITPNLFGTSAKGSIPAATQPKGLPIVATCENLVFDYQTKVAMMTPRVVVRQGENNLECEKLEFYLNPQDDSLLAAIAQTDVRTRFEQTTMTCDKAIWDHTHEQVILSGSPQITRATLVVKAPIITIYPARKFYKLQDGVFAEFQETRQGLSPKGVGFGALLSPTQGPIRLTCTEAELDELIGISNFIGNVVITQVDQKVVSDRVEVSGPPGETPERIHFPHKVKLTKADVVLVGNGGTYYVSENRLAVTGACTLWQGDDYIRADTMNFLGNENVLIAAGAVESFLAARSTNTPHDAAEPASFSFGGSKDVTIWSSQMRYDNNEMVITYSGTVIVQQEALRFTADQLQVFLQDGQGALQKITATGNVHLTAEDIQAQCQELRYLAGEDLILLLGEPPDLCRIYRNDRGTQGAVIKLYVNEKRYVVEQGMSVYMPAAKSDQPSEQKPE